MAGQANGVAGGYHSHHMAVCRLPYAAHVYSHQRLVLGYFEAARASTEPLIFQTAIRITLPNIRPIIRVCVIFAVIGSLKSYDIIFMMTKGGPIGATEVTYNADGGNLVHRPTMSL